MESEFQRSEGEKASRKKGKIEGEKIGIAKGREWMKAEMAVELVNSGVLTLAVAAQKFNIPCEKLKKMISKKDQ